MKKGDEIMTTWKIDGAHSAVQFAVRHMVVAKVRGAFTRWTADLDLDEKDLARSKVAVKIDAASIDTNNAQRDGHLRSPDFLDVENHPALTFTSKRVEQDGEDLKITGDLTIRGVTREVVLAAELGGFGVDPWGARRAAFSGKTTIDRKEFGLTWNQVLEAGGVLVSDKVEISFDVQAVAQAGARKAA
jgi:polyisoprenoid-binding protein YceI